MLIYYVLFGIIIKKFIFLPKPSWNSKKILSLMRFPTER